MEFFWGGGRGVVDVGEDVLQAFACSLEEGFSISFLEGGVGGIGQVAGVAFSEGGDVLEVCGSHLFRGPFDEGSGGIAT